MPGGVQWNGNALKARVEGEMHRRVQAASILVWNHWKTLIQIDGTGKVGKGKKAKLVYGANPSKPGEPPHVQTGQLRASAAWEVEGLLGRVGSNLKKLLHLELGTQHMAARPSLRRALHEKMPEVRAILGAPMRF